MLHNNSFLGWVIDLFSRPRSSAPVVNVTPRHDPTPASRPPSSQIVGEAPSAPRAPIAVPGGKKTLAAVIGSAGAAAALFVLVPAEESGRTVKADVQQDGTIQVTHVRGNQHLQAYRDIVGVTTICDGDTHNVRVGQIATTDECTRRLEDQLIAHAEPIIRCVPGLRGRQYQVTAAVSLAYNIGPAGFCRSTAARLFNTGNWRGGCGAFRAWNKAGGRVVRGLDIRRRQEVEICLTGLVAGKTPENLQVRTRAIR